MPIYKVGNTKKDGLQKYHVRINYVADNGQKRQITRSVYGIDVAKNLEKQLENEIKVQQEIPINKMTVKQLFDEYISIKKYEVREITLEKSNRIIKCYILPIIKDVRIDKLSTRVLQDWKISMEKRNLALTTKRNVYTELRTMLNYAVRMEYIPKHQLAKVKTIRIHDFRHSHASLLANMGINIQEVARRLGHKKVEITWDIYSHLYPKEEEKTVAILNAV